MKYSNEEYYLNYLKKNNLYTKEKYEKGLKQLQRGKPVQYVIGNVDFYGNIIDVNEDVLIPRFETELLVQKTIYYINKYFPKKDINIIDLGTGSGCIAITLKKQFPESQIDALDISDKALKVAKSNAHKHNLDINFIKGDMSKPLSKKYDVIISNPPYIDYTEEIMEIVKNNEPHHALYAKENGLYYYHKILENIKEHINVKYLIAFEIGCTQKKAIINLIHQYLNDCQIITFKDYNDLDRYIFITNQ